MKIIVLTFIYIVASGTWMVEATLPPMVFTTFGLLFGRRVITVNQDLVDFFEGIRYGYVDRRFGASRIASPWGFYNAKHFRWACAQPDKETGIPRESDQNVTDLTSETSVMSEDCLFLNVWRPSSAVWNKKLLPVMIWIHGGSFVRGSIFAQRFDSALLASVGQVIVVSINYRLGAFGFLYTGTEDAPGNQGLDDQILALQWVAQNIGSFGGDSSAITLFGESAGSMSVGALILSPKARGLFHRAIMQSGAPNSLPFASPEISIQKARQLAQRVSCNQSDLTEMVECLREIPIEVLAKASVLQSANSYIMAPVYGTPILPQNPLEMLTEGHVNPVDLMYGVVQDEGSIFIPLDRFPEIDPEKGNLTLEKSEQLIKVLVGELYTDQNQTEIIQFYLDKLDSASTQQEMRKIVYQVIGDILMVCPTVLFGEQLAKVTGRRTFAFLFAQKTAFSNTHLCPSWQGVCHGSDLDYIFGLPQRLDHHNSSDVRLSRTVMDAWLRFAKTGHPNSAGQVKWQPAISQSDPFTRVMKLADGQYQMMSQYFRNICNTRLNLTHFNTVWL